VTTIPGQLRKHVLGIAPIEAAFRRRGFFDGDAGIRSRLEQVGSEFLRGYHGALEVGQPERFGSLLNSGPAEFRGFAFEGAAMGLALLDFLTPWDRDRVRRFLAGPGEAHAYMVHVGVGWVLARVRRKITAPPGYLDPLFGWLAVDGFGFHEGYFSASRYVYAQKPPRASGYACRVFDQGLGRSIWFVDCGDVHRIPNTIAAFRTSRQADLWSGVGLACAYAGGADSAALVSLRDAAGSMLPHLSQGVAFAAKARLRAGNPSRLTDLAAEVVCGISAAAAAEITELALADCLVAGSEPAYEVWRQGIRSRLVRAAEGRVPSWPYGLVRHHSFVETPHAVLQSS
jgi:hypothetical protein